jgi:prevent-host-death family protein
MQSVGVRELKAQTSQILRQVRDKGETIEITYHGRIIAHIVPAEEPEYTLTETSDVWSDIAELAKEIGKYWPEGVSAVDAIREEMR